MCKKGISSRWTTSYVLGILSKLRWAHAPRALKKGATQIKNSPIYAPFVLVSTPGKIEFSPKPFCICFGIEKWISYK